MTSVWQTVLWVPLRSQWWRLGLIFFFLLLMSATQGLFLLMVEGFMAALFAGDFASQPLGEFLPNQAQQYFPAIANLEVSRELLVMGVPVVLLAAGSLRAMGLYGYQLQQNILGLYLAAELRITLFTALMRRQLHQVGKRGVADWISLIMNDVLFIQQRFNDTLAGVVRDSVLVISAWFWLAVIHWPSAFVVAIVGPIAGFVMGRVGRRIARYAEKFQNDLARLGQSLLEVRDRFLFIRAQAGEDYEYKRFQVRNRSYYRAVRQSIFIRAAFAPALELLGFALFAALVWAIGRGIWGVGFDGTTMLQLFIAVGLMIKPLRNLGEQLSRFQEMRGAIRRTGGLLEQFDDDLVVEGPLTSLPVEKVLPFRLAELSSSYGEKLAVSLTDLELKPGSCTAVVGPSGGGKSTFVRALAGLQPAAKWQASLPWNSMPAATAFVSQEPFLFDATIKDNLNYGLPVAASDDELNSVLAKVDLLRFVKNLPQGLYTPVQSMASTLSGGQTQRLVVARALLRGSALLILDEATSAIDQEAELKLIKTLIDDARSQSTALLAVTHRLHTLAEFDDVLFIEGGQLLARGRWESICADNDRIREFAQGLAEPGGGD